jgi:hypothetical protein
MHRGTQGKRKMTKKIVQLCMDYSAPETELSPAFLEMAPTFAAIEGLEWKTWTIDQDKKRCGGVYLFKDGASAEAFAERMVVFTARIKLEMGDVDSTLDDIRALTEVYGGFIASVNTRSGTGAITIRVPQASFYDAVSEVKGLGEVQTRDLKGEDITEDFVDLQARLSNLESQEERLNEILAMGTTVEEVLKVETELERVRGEIEGLTGEIQYLESSVELATITVLLNVSPEAQKAGWLPEVDWRTPVNAGLGALYTILQGLLSMAIVLGPFVAIGVPVYYAYKRFNGERTSS